MNTFTSLQPLGCTQINVEYEVEQINGRPNVTIACAVVNGEFVEASAFSERTLGYWEAQIQTEMLEAA